MIHGVAATPAVQPGRSLRICLVTEAAGGGVGRHFLDLAQGLSAAGVAVTCIYSPGRVDQMFDQRRPAVRSCRFVQLPLRRGVHPTDMAGLWRLARLVRQLGPFDVVHGHSSKAGALARLAARWLRVPSVYTPHAFATLDPTLAPWQRAFFGQIERRLAGVSPAIIAVSEDEADHMRALGIAGHRIHVVHNGIERPTFPARDDVRARLGLSPTEIVVGFVGRLARQKAPEILVGAFARAHRELDIPSRLVIVGSGPLESQVRSLIQSHGLASQVLLLGDVVATDIMPAFDLFCLPSRYEAMPYVFLESLAAGLPIVSTRVGGASLCVDPGVNGLLVEPDNDSALATALLSVMRDESLRRRFACASAEAASQFTIDGMVAETLAVYNQVIATAGRLQRTAAV